MKRLTALLAAVAATAGLVLAPAPAGLAQGAPPAASPQSSPEAAPGTAVHPFYRQLLDRGIYAYQQGDHESAAGDLRLAVFGLLEDPALLLRGLAHLALAQQGAGLEEEADETLGRLIVIEERFGVYAAADLGTALRQRLEELMLARVAEPTLAASDTFGGLADEKIRRRIAELPPKQRRAALAEAVARRPGATLWQVALAEIELAEGNRSEAVRLADLVLATGGDGEANASQRARAHCVRGSALADGGACAQAVASLEQCPSRSSDRAVATALLRCQVDTELWPEAADFLASLDPAVRDTRPVKRLARRVDKAVASLAEARREAAETARRAQEADREADAGTAREGTPEAADSTSGPPPGNAPADRNAGAGAGDGLDSTERARLAAARDALAGASTAADLQEPLRLAREVANANPRSTEAQHLVGEIAYRASSWEEAARYFRRGGEPRRPELRFYMAVALFESGEAGQAREVLERALPELPRNPFVMSYAERIQGGVR